MTKPANPSLTIPMAGLLIICSFFCARAAFASDSIQLALKKAVVIEQDGVRLSDIAIISGLAEDRLSTIGNTLVAKSPPPGQTRFVGPDYIRIRLRQAGFQTDAMRFGGAQDVRITRKAAGVSPKTISQAVEAAIHRQMPWNREDVEIDNIHFDDDIKLPTGSLSYRIIPNRNEDYLGRTLLGLHFYVDGQLAKKTWVHADISVMADVVKVIRPLGKRQRIAPSDLAMVRADLSGLPSDAIRDIESAVGNRTTQMIYPNTVLKAGMFSLPPLVRRGDIVKIVANAGPMTITATGKVKQKGCKGDAVHVINTDSNRVITARVIDAGTVQVDF